MSISTTTPLLAGISIDPSASAAAAAFRLAHLAEATGYDFVAIQDHPYNASALDTWTLLTALAMQTERVMLTPNVANLGLRAPAMLYKAAASLQILSGGRTVLGVGAGAFEKAIASFGGLRVNSAKELGNAFEEALQIFRLLQQPARSSVVFHGEHHWLDGAKAGPTPATSIPIWVGAQHTRGLRLIGTYADGWFCPLNLYVAPSQVLARQQKIDAAAEAAGRDPRAIRRIYNLTGLVTQGGTSREAANAPLVGPAAFWVDRISTYINDLGFDGFVFWPSQEPELQVELFAERVLPALREQIAV